MQNDEDKRELSMAKSQLNFLHTELSVESVLRDAVAKVFRAKCSSFTIPHKSFRFNTHQGKKVTEDPSSEENIPY